MIKLLKIFVVISILVIAGFITGCNTGPEDRIVPGRDLSVGWKITPGGEIYAGEGVNVCLDMSYAGDWEFDGEVNLMDNVYSGQYGGLPGDVITTSFSSGLFNDNNGVKEYELCPIGEISYNNYQNSLKEVVLFADVKIRKKESGYSGGFCVPVGLNSGLGCGLKTSVMFPGASGIKSAQIEMIKKSGSEGKIYITMVMDEVCEIIGSEAVGVKSDTKTTEFTAEDISVRLEQGSRDELNCRVKGEEKNKKRKTIICDGSISAGERYDEKIGFDVEYGCKYELERVVKFREEENMIKGDDVVA